MSAPATEIIVFAGGVEVSRFGLSPGAYSLGSALHCGVRIDLESVAPEHARLTVGGDGSLLLEDFASPQGTLLDGQPVTAPTHVAPNQSIQLGVATLLLQQRLADADDTLPAGRK